MHEMSLVEGMLTIIEDTARAHGATRIAAVHLEIGTLAPVLPEALRLCFEIATRNTIAQDARLEIDELPGVGWCASCAASVPIDAPVDLCPRCGGADVTMTGGDSMRIRDIAIA